MQKKTSRPCDALMKRSTPATWTRSSNFSTRTWRGTCRGKSKFASDYQGRDATLEYFGKIGAETGGTFRAELKDMTADEAGHVVGIQRSSGDRNGKHLDVDNCIVFQLKDGRVTDGREHFEDLYAWDEFWS